MQDAKTTIPFVLVAEIVGPVTIFPPRNKRNGWRYTGGRQRRNPPRRLKTDISGRSSTHPSAMKTTSNLAYFKARESACYLRDTGVNPQGLSELSSYTSRWRPGYK